MSIFDPNSGLNAIPWLQEKVLVVLQVATKLIDLANERDTTAWYRRKLKDLASQLVGRLAPVAALVYGAGDEAAKNEEWGPILEEGTPALARWCKKWDIADPRHEGFGTTVFPRPPDDSAEKGEVSEFEETQPDDLTALERKLQIYSSMSGRLLHDKLSRPAHRLLLWLLHDLWLTTPPDVVAVSRRHLPTDIGVSNEEAATAYKELYDLRLIERVEPREPRERDDRLGIRLIVEGLNDRKHEVAYREETFGFAGARINGKTTCGNIMTLRLQPAWSAVMERWAHADGELAKLVTFLRVKLSEDRSYVEAVQIEEKRGDRRLRLDHRFPIDEDQIALEKDIESLVDAWFREWMVKGRTDGLHG